EPGGGRSLFPSGRRGRPPSPGEVAGAAGHDEPGPPLATAGPPRRGTRRAGRRLRHVYGRLHDAGPPGRPRGTAWPFTLPAPCQPTGGYAEANQRARRTAEPIPSPFRSSFVSVKPRTGIGALGPGRRALLVRESVRPPPGLARRSTRCACRVRERASWGSG